MTKLLTAEEVAERLQVPTTRVYRAARDGELPGAKLGHYWRFDPDALADWIAAKSAGNLVDNRNGAALREQPAPGTGGTSSHAHSA